MHLTFTDYVIIALAAFGTVWVVYGVLKRVIVFLLIAAACVALLAGAGYFQTGKFSDGFFARRSGIVKFVGQLADGYRQGVLK